MYKNGSHLEYWSFCVVHLLVGSDFWTVKKCPVLDKLKGFDGNIWHISVNLGAVGKVALNEWRVEDS